MKIIVSASFEVVDAQNPAVRRFLLQTDPNLRGQMLTRFLSEVQIQLLHAKLLERAEPFGAHALYIYAVPIDCRPRLLLRPVSGLIAFGRRLILRESAYPVTAASIRSIAERVAREQNLL
ncbi:MAG TPA: hypothetical protein VNG90_05515 [Candidatus Acidoferrum sp.]|nr:hypothetical protein [Candidatus Acidoferrum sp.]